MVETCERHRSIRQKGAFFSLSLGKWRFGILKVRFRDAQDEVKRDGKWTAGSHSMRARVGVRTSQGLSPAAEHKTSAVAGNIPIKVN